MTYTRPYGYDDGDGQRKEEHNIPMLGQPLFTGSGDTTGSYGYLPTDSGPSDGGLKSAGAWSHNSTTISRLGAAESYNVSAESDYASRTSKGDTALVTPVHSEGLLSDTQQNSQTSSNDHRPVKSFSLPPWAIETDSTPSGQELQPSQLNSTTDSRDQRIPNGISTDQTREQTDGSDFKTDRFVPAAESPFTDNAAVDELHKPPQLVLESPKPMEPLEVTFDSPTTDGYFPSTLQIDTSKNGAAGPISAASDPYTMHQTFATDPIHQNTVPNAPRQLHPRSLSSHLARHPKDSAERAIRKTYPKPNPIIRFLRRFKVRHDVIKGMSEQEMVRFERKEGKKRRRLAGWRLAEEDTAEDRVGEDGVERPVVSELFWKVSCLCTSLWLDHRSDDLVSKGLHVNYADITKGSAFRPCRSAADRVDGNHAANNYLPDSRHYAPLPRRNCASSKRSLPRHKLLATL